MKIRYILKVGIIITTLVMMPYSSEKKGKIESTTIEFGQSNKIKLPQPLIINMKEEQEKQEQEDYKEIEEVNDYVYTTERVNIRTHIDAESEFLLTAEVGTKLERAEINIIQNWSSILIYGEKYYVDNKYLTSDEPEKIAKSIEDQINDSYIDVEDLRYMSAIIFSEAGNQCQAGQQAVGIVVMERKESDLFANTIRDVIYESGQFSPVENGSLIKSLSMYDNGELSDDIIESAKYVLQGNTTVYYNGMIYDLDGFLYFSRYVSGCRVQIQDHMFK